MFAIQHYQKAQSPEDAVRLLCADPEARLIAGGTDVLIKLRELDMAYTRLVDIHDLAALKPITLLPDGTLRVGAGATFTDIEQSPLIQTRLGMLGEAAASVAGPQIRNTGTLGGNLCNGAVSADTAAPVLALNGRLVILGPGGTRTTPALGFHTGPGKVALHPGELLLAVDFAPEDLDWGAHYHKYAMREAMDIATIGCAAAVRLEGDTIRAVRLAWSVAAPVPVRSPAAETAAQGASVAPDRLEATLAAVAAAVEADVKPRSSWRASKEFRLHIIRTLARRVLHEAVRRAQSSCSAGGLSC